MATMTMHKYPELRTSKRVLIVQLGQMETLTINQIMNILDLGEQSCERVIKGLAKMGYLVWNRKEAKITQMGREYLMERRISIRI